MSALDLIIYSDCVVFSGTEVSLSVFGSMDVLVAPIIGFFQKVFPSLLQPCCSCNYLFQLDSSTEHNVTKTLLTTCYRTKIKSQNITSLREEEPY